MLGSLFYLNIGLAMGVLACCQRKEWAFGCCPYGSGVSISTTTWSKTCSPTRLKSEGPGVDFLSPSNAARRVNNNRKLRNQRQSSLPQTFNFTLETMWGGLPTLVQRQQSSSQTVRPLNGGACRKSPRFLFNVGRRDLKPLLFTSEAVQWALPSRFQRELLLS